MGRIRKFKIGDRVRSETNLRSNGIVVANASPVDEFRYVVHHDDQKETPYIYVEGHLKLVPRWLGIAVRRSDKKELACIEIEEVRTAFGGEDELVYQMKRQFFSQFFNQFHSIRGEDWFVEAVRL